MSAGLPDPDADFVQLIIDHQRDLYVYIRSLMPIPEVASDALQETNRVLWEKRSTFRPGTNFIAWSFAVARNKVKQAQAERASSGGLRFDDSLIDELAAHTEESLDLLNARLSALAACIEKLEPNDRRVIEHRYAAGATAKDVATKLGRPVGWVHTAVSRIRKRLLRCINDRLSGEGWS